MRLPSVHRLDAGCHEHFLERRLALRIRSGGEAKAAR
jgi:hypothetical protein